MKYFLPLRVNIWNNIYLRISLCRITYVERDILFCIYVYLVYIFRLYAGSAHADGELWSASGQRRSLPTERDLQREAIYRTARITTDGQQSTQPTEICQWSLLIANDGRRPQSTSLTVGFLIFFKLCTCVSYNLAHFFDIYLLKWLRHWLYLPVTQSVSGPISSNLCIFAQVINQRSEA